MKLLYVTEELLRSGDYRLAELNYPNGDMVGHTEILKLR